MCERILIFGGTTEGRLLAAFCGERRIPATICVASDYGRDLVPENAWIRVRSGAMDAAGMARLMREETVGLAVDATHPYAREATANIRNACAETGTAYLRCLREDAAGRSENGAAGAEKAEDAPAGGAMRGERALDREGGGRVIRVRDAQEAVRFLEKRPGIVLLTTGSRELPVFARLSGFAKRVFARVLPAVPSLEVCGKLGLTGKHLICMQGPFTRELNEALIRQVGADFLVTKETGRAGGYEEKIEAALRCGITAVVIGRPEEDGLGWREISRKLEEFARGPDLCGKETELLPNDSARGECRVVLAGVGTGARELMTGEAVRLIRESGVILGAPRVLECAASVLEGRETSMLPFYLPSDVINFLSGYSGEGRVSVLFSGDPGFFSGAKKLAEELEKRGIPFQILPGISSVSYFAARLHTGWENAVFCTAHGRRFSPEKAFGLGADKIFLLLGGENGAGSMLETLCEEGLGGVQVFVGENLSYEGERIRTGTARELRGQCFEPLCLMMLRRESREEPQPEVPAAETGGGRLEDMRRGRSDV